MHDFPHDTFWVISWIYSFIDQIFQTNKKSNCIILVLNMWKHFNYNDFVLQ